MMMNDDTYEKLDDYLDGLLPEDERRTLEAALAASDELRAELAALRTLRDETAALPREIAPERDLWPEIAARLAGSREDATGTVVTFRRPGRAIRRSSTWSYLIAAAAILLFMLGAPVMLDRSHAPEAVPADPLADAPGLPDDAEFKRVAAQYIEARNQLATLLAQRRNDIAPETLAVVEENLSVIASAVSEIEMALAKEPQSRELERMLYAVYRSEVDLLQQAIQLADGSAASNEADGQKGDSNETA